MIPCSACLQWRRSVCNSTAVAGWLLLLVSVFYVCVAAPCGATKTTTTSSVAFATMHGRTLTAHWTRVAVKPVVLDASSIAFSTAASWRRNKVASTMMALKAASDEAMTDVENKQFNSDQNDNGSCIHTTVTLPMTLAELWLLPAGECVSTDPIRLQGHRKDETFDFAIQLYPRGSQAPSTNRATRRGGFGMSSKVVPLFSSSSKNDETVDVYVQFLPRDVNQQVDASFAVRLMGQQAAPQRRFDVEWRAGMRFCHESHCQLSQGRANDFGSRLLQTRLLPAFMGTSMVIDLVTVQPLQLQVSIQLHSPPNPVLDAAASTNREDESATNRLFSFRDVRLLTDNVNGQDGQHQQHDAEQVRVGRIVVPVLNRLSQRPKLFALGAYPGVEYRILRIHDNATDSTNNSSTGTDYFYSRPGAFYDIKPIYPLVAQLERPWPVTVCEADIPKLVTPTQYNVISAVGSLVTAFTGLLTAFVISQAVSFYYIPSRSMDPTLAVGDVLLVEKVSPRVVGLARGLGLMGDTTGYRVDDVVLFTPPERLQSIVTQSGGRINSRDLFVKRIAAQPGDAVTVDRSVTATAGTVQVNGVDVSTRRRDLCDVEPLGLIQRYIAQGSASTADQAGTAAMIVPSGTVEVLGDCGSVSIDSRVWGPLPLDNIVGRPIARLWPLSKFGTVPSLSPLSLATD